MTKEQERKFDSLLAGIVFGNESDEKLKEFVNSLLDCKI